jgi:hypothetical protein
MPYSLYGYHHCGQLILPAVAMVSLSYVLLQLNMFDSGPEDSDIRVIKLAVVIKEGQ